jgi:hypothetical protein
MEQTKRDTANHLGKAVDLHVYSKVSNSWQRDANDRAKNTVLCDSLRTLFENKCDAKLNWTGSNNFSLEPKTISDTWVHLDVRQYANVYLDDKFFSKTEDDLNAKPICNLLRGY